MTVREMLRVTTAILLIGIIGCSSSGTSQSANPVASADQTGAPKITGITYAAPELDISFSVPSATYAHLEVWNATGYHVCDLFSEEVPAGTVDITWDLLNDNGDQVKGGIYIYHLTAGGFSDMKVFFLNLGPEEVNPR